MKLMNKTLLMLAGAVCFSAGLYGCGAGDAAEKAGEKAAETTEAAKDVAGQATEQVKEGTKATEEHTKVDPNINPDGTTKAGAAAEKAVAESEADKEKRVAAATGAVAPDASIKEGMKAIPKTAKEIKGEPVPDEAVAPGGVKNLKVTSTKKPPTPMIKPEPKKPFVFVAKAASGNAASFTGRYEMQPTNLDKMVAKDLKKKGKSPFETSILVDGKGNYTMRFGAGKKFVTTTGKTQVVGNEITLCPHLVDGKKPASIAEGREWKFKKDGKGNLLLSYKAAGPAVFTFKKV